MNEDTTNLIKEWLEVDKIRNIEQLQRMLGANGNGHSFPKKIQEKYWFIHFGLSMVVFTGPKTGENYERIPVKHTAIMKIAAEHFYQEETGAKQLSLF